MWFAKFFSEVIYLSDLSHRLTHTPRWTERATNRAIVSVASPSPSELKRLMISIHNHSSLILVQSEDSVESSKFG